MGVKKADFYLISNQVADAKYKLASRLSNKLQRLKQRTLIVTDGAEASLLLDKLMWSFSGTSFVAHEQLNQTQTAQSNIHIADVESVTAQVLNDNDYQVMINLAEHVPPFNHHFSRIAEIIESSDTDKANGRQRYKDYKAEGFELKMHNIEL